MESREGVEGREGVESLECVECVECAVYRGCMECRECMVCRECVACRECVVCQERAACQEYAARQECVERQEYRGSQKCRESLRTPHSNTFIAFVLSSRFVFFLFSMRRDQSHTQCKTQRKPRYMESWTHLSRRVRVDHSQNGGGKSGSKKRVPKKDKGLRVRQAAQSSSSIGVSPEGCGKPHRSRVFGTLSQLRLRRGRGFTPRRFTVRASLWTGFS